MNTPAATQRTVKSTAATPLRGTAPRSQTTTPPVTVHVPRLGTTLNNRDSFGTALVSSTVGALGPVLVTWSV